MGAVVCCFDGSVRINEFGNLKVPAVFELQSDGRRKLVREKGEDEDRTKRINHEGRLVLAGRGNPPEDSESGPLSQFY